MYSTSHETALIYLFYVKSMTNALKLEGPKPHKSPLPFIYYAKKGLGEIVLLQH